jgi:tryptophanyl-tRNA synthetase
MFDSPDEIEKKIKKSVTDNDGDVRFDWENKPGVSNLLEILSACTSSPVETVGVSFRGYGDLKKATADALIETLSPVQKRYRELLSDPAELDRLAADGAHKATAVARHTYETAANAMGLLTTKG